MIGILLGLAALLSSEPHPSQPDSPPISLAPSPRAPALDPRLTDAFRSVKARRYEEARRGVDAYLQSAGAAHPGQAHFVAGLSYHQQHLYESARARFARAVELEPDYLTAYFFYGFALYNLGRLEEARQALEKYVAFDPDAAEAAFGLGLVALEQDRVDDAERGFRRAIALAQGKSAGGPMSAALREDSARYEARLADVYLRRDDLPRAREALERSVELWPGHFEPWHKLALTLRRLGDSAGADRAEARYAEALQRRGAGGGPTP